MTKTLLVPDYILEQQRAKKKAEEAAKSKTIAERVPQPTGWRILVMPYMGKEKTDGGIYIPDAAREKEARATTVAYVVKVGPLAYQDPNKFGDDSEPWCKEGDWVCIGRYAGSRFNIEGGEVRIINDDEVIATIIDPDDMNHLVRRSLGKLIQTRLKMLAVVTGSDQPSWFAVAQNICQLLGPQPSVQVQEDAA